jgi:hypothetical protein
MRTEPPIPKELWDTIPPAAQAALLVAFEHLEQRVELLEHEIADLKSRLNQNSTNSSRPPSSDPPSVKRAPPNRLRARNAAANWATSIIDGRWFPQRRSRSRSTSDRRSAAPVVSPCLAMISSLGGAKSPSYRRSSPW